MSEKTLFDTNLEDAIKDAELDYKEESERADADLELGVIMGLRLAQDLYKWYKENGHG